VRQQSAHQQRQPGRMPPQSLMLDGEAHAEEQRKDGEGFEIHEHSQGDFDRLVKASGRLCRQKVLENGDAESGLQVHEENAE